MSRLRRVVFDTSTLVSAALREGSIPDRALLYALDACELCASESTMAEVGEVLLREKFDRYLGREARLAFLALIRERSRIVAIEVGSDAAITPSCRDTKDNKFLALAMRAEADVLISSDHDLLDLDPWHGIAIITPAVFLALSQDHPEP